MKKWLRVMILAWVVGFLLCATAIVYADSYLACSPAPVTMQSVEVRIDGVVYDGLLSADQPQGLPQYLLYNVSALPTWELHTFLARWSDVPDATGAEWSAWSIPFGHTERSAPGGLFIVVE